MASSLAATCAMRGEPAQRLTRFRSPFVACLAFGAGTIAFSIQTAVPAFADGGAGGNFSSALPLLGGAGGTGFTGNPGGNGAASSGGGGGGAGGGNGGVGTRFSPIQSNAPGGTAAHPDGFDGAAGSLITNGGGGGGGFGGFNGNGAGAASINNNAPLTGNNGGNGGKGGGVFESNAGAGGGGGAGGFGAIVTGAGASSNGSSIAGGKGGNGGDAGTAGHVIAPGGFNAAGGNGGDGGTGVLFTASGATFVNSGSVAGGAGGAGGLGTRGTTPARGPDGVAGLGGVGVSGAGLTVINSGTISGGVSGDGAQRANAVSFTGGTNIFELRGGSAVTGNVVAFSTADTFRLGGATNGTFDVSQLGPAAQFRGFGIDEKNGSSIWTLTGTTASITPWTINAGTLSVNGSIASSSLTTVNSGGTLSGIGTVGNTTVASGGAFAPGNGTPGLSTTVAGNLAFQSGALYLVQLNPATATFASVSGTATLGGATVNANFAAGSYINKRYTIVNAAGGIAGTFGSVVNSNVPANFTSSLSYDANNAYLNLALTFVPPPNMGLNANQQNVANAIVGFFNSNGTIPLAFGGLTPAGLTQVSGELATGSQQTTFDAMGLFMGLLTDPFIAGRGDPVSAGAGATPFAAEDEALAYASNGKPRSKNERDAYAAVYRKAPVMADPFVQRWSVWAAGYGGSQTTDGNTALGSNNTRSSIGGVAVGADYRFSPYTLAGFAIAGGGTNFSVNGLGSGRSDLFQAGAFVRHTVGAAYITGALAYGWQDITTDRTVTVAGTDLLRASFNANAFSGRVEGGYRFVTPWMATGVTPYAAGQFVTFDLPAYAEQAIAGANTFALTYASKSVTDTRSELGLRSDKSFAVQDGIFTLRGRAAWAHDFNTDRSITPTFQTLPGASFVVNGAAHAPDSALVTASAEMKWLNGFSLAGTFEGEFSNVTASYAGKGVVRYAW
jgi:uncharacterized protein with beta-barrel porin domain